MDNPVGNINDVVYDGVNSSKDKIQYEVIDKNESLISERKILMIGDEKKTQDIIDNKFKERSNDISKIFPSNHENCKIELKHKNPKIIIKEYIGHISEAHHYILDNEFILKGYRINFHSCKRISRSICMCHNETINVWTHFIGAVLTILFMCLVIFNIGPINPNFFASFKNMNNTKNHRLIERANFKKMENPFENNIYSSLIEKNERLKHLVKLNFTSYSVSKKEQNEIQEIFDSLESYIKMRDKSHESDKITILKNDIFEDLLNRMIDFYNTGLSEEKQSDLKQIKNLYKMFFKLKRFFNQKNQIENSFNLRVLEYGAAVENKSLESIEDNDGAQQNDKTPKWPVVIHLISALFCLCCSTTYHLFSAYSSKVGNILSRLDYAGISVLVAGSCLPPYYYIFCCTKVFLILYLTFICTFAIIVFFISLMDKFNQPQYRRLRGFLFLALGISTALPLMHYIFFFDIRLGMIEQIKIIYWAIGGLIYISGCLIYIARFPERYCPGKFDIIGSSHQIWHIFVVSGVVFHHIASILNYHDRLKVGCLNINN